MSTMTVRRCRSCPRALKRNETGQCNDCACVDASLRGLGSLKSYPLVAVEDLPAGALCAFCQQKNTPERAEAMYFHNDGIKGTHWYAHAGCELQREYDRVEELRDTGYWGDGGGD